MILTVIAIRVVKMAADGCYDDGDGDSGGDNHAGGGDDLMMVAVVMI